MEATDQDKLNQSSSAKHKMVIRQAEQKDAKAYRLFCENVIVDCFLTKKLGFSDSDFDESAFHSEKIKSHFKKLVTPTLTNRSVFVEIDGKLAAGVTIQKRESENHIIGPYVAKDHLTKGLGMQLFAIVEKTVGKEPLSVSVFAGAWQAINLYVSRGFIIDPKRPYKIIHPEWLKDNTGLLEYRLMRGISVR